MTTYERAIQIYQILIAAAHNRQTVTYQMVSDLIGVPRHGLAPHLDRLLRYCQRHDLPPLTVLVVQKDSGKPGSGFETGKPLDSEREMVFGHPWYSLRPLTAEALASDGEHTH